MKRRVPALRQESPDGCGPTCLAAIAAFHGVPVTPAQAMAVVQASVRGTSMQGLLDASGRLGLSATGVAAEMEGLRSVALPAIAHVRTRGEFDHYLVVCAVGRRSIKVMDPAIGTHAKLSYKAFAQRWTGALLMVSKAQGGRPPLTAASPAQLFWQLLRPHGAALTHAMVAALVYSILSLATAIYLQKVVDDVLPARDSALLAVLSIGVLVIIGVQVGLSVIRGLITLGTGQEIDARLSLGFYRHVYRLPQSYFDGVRPGELLARASDANRIRALINDSGPQLASHVLVLLCSFALVLAYSTGLAALTFGLLIAYACLYWLINALNRHGQRLVMEAGAELNAVVVEGLGKASMVKQFGIESMMLRRIEVRVVAMLEQWYRSALVYIGASATSELTSRVFAVLVLWVGGNYVIRGDLSPGSLLSCFSLTTGLIGPVVAIVNANRTVQDALIAARRLGEVIEQPAEKMDGLIEVSRAQPPAIAFERVSFSYSGRADVLCNFSFSARAGEMLALVGESGCGKSTTAALIQGLYPVVRGCVTVGGYDVRQLDIVSLRSCIGVVPQRIELMSGTVAQNIALGEEEPDMVRVSALVEELGLRPTIDALPNGLLSRIGEGGGALSAGQQQRLALARALYRPVRLLILDEATSALDGVAERVVQRVVQDFKAKGGTVIVIAHRLSTVHGADRIVVMGHGQVLEEGTHEQLLSRRGKYHELWSHHSRNGLGGPDSSVPSPLEPTLTQH